MYIAALSSAAQRSHYSNYGPGISLTAPSSNGHTYFRMQVTGLGITTTTGLGTGITNNFGGTSSATPLVAGIAALVISANPNLSASEVIALLKSTASKDLDFTEYPKTAPTDFDPDTSWDVSPVAPFDTGQFVDDGSPEGTWSPWFGHGKVDALAAVTSALAGTTPQPNPNPEPEPNPAPTGTFQATDSPSLSIPDNNPTGVVATINVPKTGSLTAITLALDISHTYRGDLVVSLIAPSGKETILHNRSGASANDLKVTFDNSNSALDSLLGEAINGDWQLSVKDLAGQDIGTLNNWEIDLKFNEAKEVNAQESPSITIPDNNPSGIERTLTIAESGKIRSIEVAIDLTHTYIGDLTVTLISPQSNAIILHERTGRSADNIIRTFTASEVDALAALQGESVQGDWRLRVVDAANRDEGKLNLWGLRIELE